MPDPPPSVARLLAKRSRQLVHARQERWFPCPSRRLSCAIVSRAASTATSGRRSFRTPPMTVRPVLCSLHRGRGRGGETVLRSATTRTLTSILQPQETTRLVDATPRIVHLHPGSSCCAPPMRRSRCPRTSARWRQELAGPRGLRRLDRCVIDPGFSGQSPWNVQHATRHQLCPLEIASCASSGCPRPRHATAPPLPQPATSSSAALRLAVPLTTTARASSAEPVGPNVWWSDQA